MSTKAGQLHSFADPSGDPLATAGTAFDVLKVVTRRIDNSPFGSYDTLQTEITFAQPVVLPPVGTAPDEGTETVFRVYFDTDQDAATGNWNNGLCSGTGIEMLVDGSTAADGSAGRLANGNYNVVDDDFVTVLGQATVSVSGAVLTVDVPLTVLSDDGQTNLSVRVGNGVDAYLDCGPAAGGAIITRLGPGSDRRK